MQPPLVCNIMQNHGRHLESACDQVPMVCNIIKNHSYHMETVCETLRTTFFGLPPLSKLSNKTIDFKSIRVIARNFHVTCVISYKFPHYGWLMAKGGRLQFPCDHPLWKFMHITWKVCASPGCLFEESHLVFWYFLGRSKIYHIVIVFFKGHFRKYLAHSQKYSKKCPIFGCFQRKLFILALGLGYERFWGGSCQVDQLQLSPTQLNYTENRVIKAIGVYPIETFLYLN